MHRSALVSWSGYFLLALTCVVLGQSVRPAAVAIEPGGPRIGQLVDSAQLSAGTARQHSIFDDTFGPSRLFTGECYGHYGQTSCLHFPTQPRQPCKTDFVYHGLHGAMKCQGR